MHHRIHRMKATLAVHFSLHQLKQHPLQPRLILANRSAVQPSQVLAEVPSNEQSHVILFSVESICAATQENNKKNVTIECADQRIVQ